MSGSLARPASASIQMPLPWLSAQPSGKKRLHYSPSVMRALLVRTFPSINFSTARTLQRIPLKMETLNRKSS